MKFIKQYAESIAKPRFLQFSFIKNNNAKLLNYEEFQMEHTFPANMLNFFGGSMVSKTKFFACNGTFKAK